MAVFKIQSQTGTADFFTNTLSSRKEQFIPLKAGNVTMYSCGPTVYGEAHIGNLRSQVFPDTIARVLLDAGFHVRRVVNITDVGHLTSDGDEGEDKMSVGAAREKKKPAEIAERYAKLFIKDLEELNIDTESILFPRATEYIKEQIALAKTLEEKGFAYRTPQGLYFDVSKFATYGKLGGVYEATLRAGLRVGTAGKRHPADFALWRLAKPHDLQQWDSPWGRGNPGWHIECSAMIRALLGQEIDIHTGGEDLIPTHHNNEIAQSEAASGRPFVRYWMHGAHLNIQSQAISKSLGNVITLSEIIAKGYHPLALRYLFLQAHYRTPLSFSWETLGAAAEALTRLWRISEEVALESEKKSSDNAARTRFVSAIRDDLGTPQAIGILWESLKSEEFAPEEKWGLLEDADRLLGLSLSNPPRTIVPADIQQLVDSREAARVKRDFPHADELRKEIEHRGYSVDDGPSGPVVSKRPR